MMRTLTVHSQCEKTLLAIFMHKATGELRSTERRRSNTEDEAGLQRTVTPLYVTFMSILNPDIVIHMFPLLAPTPYSALIPVQRCPRPHTLTSPKPSL